MDPHFTALSDVTRVQFLFSYLRFASRCSDLGDEYGWKQVHGDVFRAPSHPVIFSSVVGCGTQIFAISLLAISLIILGEFWIEYASCVDAR